MCLLLHLLRDLGTCPAQPLSVPICKPAWDGSGPASVGHCGGTTLTEGAAAKMAWRNGPGVALGVVDAWIRWCGNVFG